MSGIERKSTRRLRIPTRRKKASDIGVLEKIPYDITMYKILRFIEPKDLFMNVQIVNSFFHSLVWKSLKNSRIYTDEVFVEKSKFHWVEYYLTNFNATYGKILNGENLKKMIIKLHFNISSRVFCKLCEVGAVDLGNYGRKIFSYVLKVLNFMCWLTYDRNELSNYQILHETLTNTLQTLVDCCDFEFEDQNTELRKSYFHDAYYHRNTYMIEFLLRNEGKFRTPKFEESRFYLLPQGEDYDDRNAEVLCFLKHYPFLDVNQELFEEYFLRVHLRECSCCDSNYHLCQFLKTFLPFYYQQYFTNSDEKTHKKEKVIPHRLYVTDSMIDGILKLGPREGYGDQTQKLELMIEFVEKFGIHEKLKDDEETKQTKDEIKYVQLGSKETEWLIEKLRKGRMDSINEKKGRNNGNLEIWIDSLHDKMERRAEDNLLIDEKSGRRRKVVSSVYKDRFYQSNKTKVIRRRRRRRTMKSYICRRKRKNGMKEWKTKKKKVKGRERRKRKREIFYMLQNQKLTHFD